MMKDHEVIRWAIAEIRGLDELCRSQVPGYGSLEQGDLERLRQLATLAETLGAPVKKEPVKKDRAPARVREEEGG